MMTTTEKQPPLLTLAGGAPGPQQGHWTYSDYAALDDGQRYEIMNGVLLMTPAPSWNHQEVTLEIATHLRAYLRTNILGGVFVAPIDVELTPKGVVQPDIVVLLKQNRHKLREKHIVGAPDMVVEVATPATAPYDRLNKYEAYRQAGVPEYWIVDPNERTIEAFLWENGDYRSLGIFSGKDTIPSQILPGLDVPVETLFFSVW